MIASVRRLSNSIVGKLILVLFVVTIFASFALADMQGLSSGTFGANSSSLVTVGSEEVSDRDMSNAFQRRLAEVRQTNPAADYATIAGDFDPLMELLVRDAAIRAFADQQDMTLSKRLIDAEIARIPATKGLDGRFSQSSYQAFLSQQKLTDADLRKLLSGGLLERLVLQPVSANVRVPVGMATPYASMLLEAREAEVALIPTEQFLATIPAPTQTDLRTFYQANARRYLVPEQRVLSVARIGPAQVAGVVATDKEIADYYNANQATFGGATRRVISQAVVPSKAAADAIAGRARTGGFVDATKPAGFSAADISVGPQTRDQFARLASDQVAAAAFAAASGAIVGPIQSDLGWHVVKIDGIQVDAGTSLAAARASIAERLTADKRKGALADLVAKVEDAIAEGSSFAEAVTGAGLTATKSPLILANGTSRANPAFKFPADLAPVLRGGFDLTQDDDPVVETLADGAGYALVAADQIVSAAPEPLATIQPRVTADWRATQARAKARTAAAAVAAQVAKGTDFTAALAASGTKLPPPRKTAIRRMQLAQMQGEVPPALNMMFALAQGGSRMIADPEGRGFIIVKVNKIIPGNAMLQPALIARTQAEFQEAVSGEYAEQMARAIQADLGVKRNDKVIAAARKRILGELVATKILAIDNYDSFTFTLVDYLRVAGAEVTVLRNDACSARDALAGPFDGFLISPGPGRPEEAGISVDLARGCIEMARPLLGVCLGHQAIALACGQQVGRVPPMHGKIASICHDNTGLFERLPTPFAATRYHSLAVGDPAPPLIANAWSEDGVVMAMRHERVPVHGVQFHPESIASEHGHALLGAFLAICRAS